MTHDNFGAAAPETKAYGPDANAAQAMLMEAFEAFKDANDQRLGEIERKLSADVLTDEKVERINRAVGEQKAALERLSLDLKRPHGAPAPRAPQAPGERKQAFDAYLRTGDAGELVRLESKSGPLIAGADADGGYLAPDETERTIERLLRDVSPIRAIASVRQTSANTLRKPVARQGFASGWAAETASRPQTDTTDFEVVDFPAMELYAMPAATPQLLDDALVNVEQWIAEEVQEAFAAQESQAFVNGDGTAKPRGFLSYTNVADASWVWGQIGYVASGAAGDFAASNPVDRLIDLAYAPKQVYRANARFVMNRLTEARVRKLKDSDGDYIWQPGMSAGAPATLLGFPVTEAEAMPNVAANSFSIAFGDFARGYLIVDRAGVRILRDPYSAKPYVLFYTTKRVGGGVQNFEAIKLMKFAAS